MVGNGLFPSYQKNESIYPVLKEKTEFALENSAWLKNEQAEELKHKKNDIYQLNPYTDVDRLVSSLFGFSKSYQVYNFDISYFKKTGKIEFRIEKKEDGFNVRIGNKGLVQWMANPENISNYFNLVDQAGKEINISIEKTVSIEPNGTGNFEVKPSEMITHGKLCFCLDNENSLFFF